MGPEDQVTRATPELSRIGTLQILSVTALAGLGAFQMLQSTGSERDWGTTGPRD